ncbi:AAA family ATPase [Pseudooceanicola sp. 200-1SW]|uniref:AAA family ATPase n=1 Tax=Pseudooceanicola sp. 200-1SW TaxID=3425949 RepID=UPI003D7F86DA
MPPSLPARHVLLSGCSGGGKSTLLAELARRGLSVVPEPGRRIVAEETLGDGAALPWVDLAAFARRAWDVARADRQGLPSGPGWVIFDRGLVDAALTLQEATGQDAATLLAAEPPFHRQVFLTPPWPEIFHTDAERQHGFDAALAEYDRLHAGYARLGYQVVILPKVSVTERADFVLRHLG